MKVDDKIRKIEKHRNELFDIANSYGGDETGHIAVVIHQACNCLLEALSLLPKPCEKVFSCRHFKEYSQSVPMPFGSGSCSEPLGDCAIESESEDCTLECPDYKEAGCRPEQQLNKPPAGEIEEFVKGFRQWLIKNKMSMGFTVYVKANQACTHLEALLKQIKGLEGEKESLKAGLLIDARRFAEQKEQIKQLSECITELEGEKKGLEDGLIKIRKSDEIMEARRFADQTLKGE